MLRNALRFDGEVYRGSPRKSTAPTRYGGQGEFRSWGRAGQTSSMARLLTPPFLRRFLGLETFSSKKNLCPESRLADKLFRGRSIILSSRSLRRQRFSSGPIRSCA